MTGTIQTCPKHGDLLPHQRHVGTNGKGYCKGCLARCEPKTFSLTEFIVNAGKRNG